MEVILLERIEKLGQMGDVVTVKNGYARNFLLPQKKALRATEENKRRFDEGRQQLEAVNVERRTEAEALAKKLAGRAVVMIRQAGEAGQLYGSVNARDIAAGLTDAGVTVERQQVVLSNPIKALGLYEVKIALHPEVAVAVVVNVARSDDEAKVQAKTGKAVVGADDDVPDEPEAAAAAAPADDTPAVPTEAIEEAADEAVVEQAEEIFEDGAAPTVAPEGEDPPGDAPADADAPDAAEGGAAEKPKP